MNVKALSGECERLRMRNIMELSIAFKRKVHLCNSAFYQAHTHNGYNKNKIDKGEKDAWPRVAYAMHIE